MTLAVDFDGVIHAYTRGWYDGSIYDPPLPGAIQSLHDLMGYDAVFVFTSRDPHQVAPWLQGHGLDATTDDRCGACLRAGERADCAECHGTNRLTFWDQRGQLLVTQRKLPATAYLDDRAIRFTDWSSAMVLLGEATGRARTPTTPAK
jgi:hypothetical protein